MLEEETDLLGRALLSVPWRVILHSPDRFQQLNNTKLIKVHSRTLPSQPSLLRLRRPCILQLAPRAHPNRHHLPRHPTILLNACEGHTSCKEATDGHADAILKVRSCKFAPLSVFREEGEGLFSLKGSAMITQPVTPEPPLYPLTSPTPTPPSPGPSFPALHFHFISLSPATSTRTSHSSIHSRDQFGVLKPACRLPSAFAPMPLVFPLAARRLDVVMPSTCPMSIYSCCWVGETGKKTCCEGSLGGSQSKTGADLNETKVMLGW
jgi:hypothetical protein